MVFHSSDNSSKGIQISTDIYQNWIDGNKGILICIGRFRRKKRKGEKQRTIIKSLMPIEDCIELKHFLDWIIDDFYLEQKHYEG